MKKRKRPRFRIGDTVVVTIYGTVGKVTDVKQMEDEFMYEVNGNEGLFKEKVLELLDTYDGYIFEVEQIDIEYKFQFGDLVFVKGYENELFKVVGYRTEIWRYKENAWEDTIYELVRVSDGNWLEVDEEELTLIADSEQTDSFLRKYGYILSKRKQAKQKLMPTPLHAHDRWIDYLLDYYNDYKDLYKNFKDHSYKLKMDSILEQLKKHTNKVSEINEKE